MVIANLLQTFIDIR